MQYGRVFGAVALVAMALATSPASADGDPAKGEKVFKKCAACHSLEAGKNKIGPTLAGVLGRSAGSLEGFKYSDAMVGSGVVWSTEAIDAFLAKPKDFIAGTKMAFPGLGKEDDREDLIAYLQQAAQ